MKTQAENTLVDLEPGDVAILFNQANAKATVVKVTAVASRSIVVDFGGSVTFRRKSGEEWNGQPTTLRLMTDEEARQYVLALGQKDAPAKAPKAKTALPATYGNFCYCGCGDELSHGGKSTFRMGHDMRLHGLLAKATHRQDPRLTNVPEAALTDAFLSAFHKGRFANLPRYAGEAEGTV